MKFRKKTAVVEAMQWDGNNHDTIVKWVQGDWGKPTEFYPNQAEHGKVQCPTGVIYGEGE